ncbi:hypothetical protein [Pseudomonas putida]|uniref:hypothetical protein n=1 Tax=Pseudomonas putida TaxID=303 RepID=UPI001CD64820|nr:hypothetical protein [Pseudomonas putida]
MKNDIGYREFTAFKRSPRRCAAQIKRFPTKNTPTATFLGNARGQPNEGPVHSFDVEGANLPDFVVRAVSGFCAFAWEFGR